MLAFSINFLISGIYIIVKYRTVSKCFFASCRSGSLLDSVNYFDSDITKILFGINVVILIGLKYLFLSYVKKFEMSVNGDRITPSSFTAQVINIKDIEESKKLPLFFESTVPGVEVLKVNLVYNISEFYTTITKLVDLESKLVLLERKGLNSIVRYKYYVIKRYELQKKYWDMQKTSAYIGASKKLFTGTAFVTFGYQSHLADILAKLQYKIGNITIQKSKYNVLLCQEPQDIIWENFGLTKRQYYTRKITSIFISLILIFISFIIIILIKVVQERYYVDSVLSRVYYFIALIISLVIVVINILFKLSLVRLSFWEKRLSHTETNTSMVFKISVAYFVNTAILILIVNLAIKYRIWTSDGLLGNVQVIQIVSMFTSSVFDLLNPFYFYRKFKRWYYDREIRQSYKNNSVVQYDLNAASEGQIFSISDKYCFLFKLISVVFFFQTIMPYLHIMGVIELLITYWVQKYILVKRAQRPKDIAFNFSLAMTRGFDVTIIIMTVGFLVFKIVLTKTISIFAILVVCLTVLSFFASEGISCKFFKSSHQITSNKHFSEVCKSFSYDYDRLNPITIEKPSSNG